ncbi:MAG: PAS domain S-box protein [Verrucomicrobiota bacterium]
MKTDSSNNPAGGTPPSSVLRFLGRPVARYVGAVAVFGVACVLRFSFASILESKLAYMTFFPAVMVAATFGGAGPGLVVTFLSALFVAYWILQPVHAVAVTDTSDIVGLILFSCLGVFMSVLGGLYRRANARVLAYERDNAVCLQELVAARTLELQREQAALQDRELRLQMFVEHTPVPVAMLDSQMRYLAVSKSWQANYKLADVPLIGRSHYEVFPEIPGRWKEIHRRCLAGAVEHCDEDRFERPDGSVQWLRWEIRPWQEGGGEIGGVIIFTEDITARKQIQEALRVRSTALEAAANGIVITNRAGTIEWVNAAFTRLTGYGAAEAIGQNPRVLKSARHPAKFYSGLWSTIVAGQVWRSELVNRRKDGTLYDEEMTITPVRNDSGEIANFIAIKQDISGRKHAEAVLEVTLQRINMVLSSMYSGVLLVSAEGRVEFANQAFCDQFGLAEAPVDLVGCSPDVMLGRIKGAYLQPEEALTRIHKLLERGEPLRGEEIAMSGGRTFLRDFVPLRVNGKLYGRLWLHTDITELRRAEEQLNLLSTAVESVANGIVITDRYGKILWVNPAFTSLTGYSRTEAVGQNPRLLKSGQNPREFYRRMWTTLLNGDPWHGELVNRYKDGSLYQEEMTITPVKLGGADITHFVAIKQDVTERKRAEEQVKLAEATLQAERDQLEARVQQRTADLSALNNLLQAEILKRQGAEEAHQLVQRHLAEAQETERGRISRELHDRLGQDLTALKVGLQNLRRQGSFSAPPERDIHKLEKMAEGLIGHLHRLAWELRPSVLDDLGLELALQRYTDEWSQNTGIPVDLHIGANSVNHRLPHEFETVLYRITQEALTNVARHTQAHRVSVLLERRPGYVSLIVEDDGQGFDAQELLKAPASRHKLGLLGMQERAKLAGGTLTIESAAEVGTAVIARLPIPPGAAGKG